MRVGTFNVRGLTSLQEKRNLEDDLKNYHVDVVALQETKDQEQEWTSRDKYKIVLFKHQQSHYGSGFGFSEKAWSICERVWYVNDRISVAQLTPFKNKVKSKLILINAYMPTMQITRKDKGYERDSMYEVILDICKEYRNEVIVILGDFNSKVGSKCSEACIGSHSRGVRNDNGQALVDFVSSQSLFIANTSFKHNARHITTWSQSREITSNNTTKTINIYNQIDYIILPKWLKSSLTDSRSWAGTSVNSDHRLVTADINWKELHKCLRKRNTSNQKQFDSNILANNTSLRKKYGDTLAEEINKLKISGSSEIQEASKTIEQLKAAILTATEKHLPELHHAEKSTHIPQYIQDMINKQKSLRLKIYAANKTETIRKLKSERNMIQNNITRELKRLEEDRLDLISMLIDQSSESKKMYAATKMLYSGSKVKPVIHDNKGRTVTNNRDKVELVKEHFQEKYRASDSSSATRNTDDSQLANPITPSEIENALEHLNNDKSPGIDRITSEQLKYAPSVIHKIIANALNRMLEKDESMEEINTGVLSLIQKPGKPKGPVGNLRPIFLLSNFRKMLSLIVLKRICDPIENYISHSQAAYRRKRSTSDIVWVHKFLSAIAQKEKTKFVILGLDMSSAFDTIDREKLIHVLENIQGISKDDLIMIKKLLKDTKLKISFGQQTRIVNTQVGSPQGDSLSPILFTTYLEAVLREARSKLTVKPIFELAYADDTDFVFETEEDAVKCETEIDGLFQQWNLKLNKSKTEITVLERRVGNKKDEPWRRTRKLGSLIGDAEDLVKRKTLACAALHKLNELWKRKDKVSETRRVKLYKSLVLPILTYNCSTWALTSAALKELDCFHRKQLRRVLGIRYPRIIKNEKLYEKTQSVPLSVIVIKQRWKLFGHILRLDEATPAQKVMSYYFSKNRTKHTGFQGRPRTTLPMIINHDLASINKRSSTSHDHSYAKTTLPSKLSTVEDLAALKEHAQDRKDWQDLVAQIVSSQTTSQP